MAEGEDGFSRFFMSAVLRGQAPSPTPAPPMLLAFVDVLDSLDRLVEAAGQDQALAPAWRDHLAALRLELIAVFASGGLQVPAAVGEPFDPRRHEAVDLEVRDDLRRPRVLAQYSRGCTTADGQVLRYARVRVGRGPDESERTGG